MQTHATINNNKYFREELPQGTSEHVPLIFYHRHANLRLLAIGSFLTPTKQHNPPQTWESFTEARTNLPLPRPQQLMDTSSSPRVQDLHEDLQGCHSQVNPKDIIARSIPKYKKVRDSLGTLKSMMPFSQEKLATTITSRYYFIQWYRTQHPCGSLDCPHHLLAPRKTSK